MRRRTLLRLLAISAAQRLKGSRLSPSERPSPRVVLVTIGGIRRQESFSTGGLELIPKLAGELLPQSLFYPYVANEGVTSHFNTISSILTGVWQHVDDWGAEKPAHPTLFECLQKQRRLPAGDTWVVTSNKQLTANIAPGFNVVLSKQLLIEAAERIIRDRRGARRLERESLLAELRTVYENDYERIGWSVPSPSEILDPGMKESFLKALSTFINGPGVAPSADELTFIMACEVLRRAAPSLLMVNFSDVEVAHAGAYSLHLAGIRRADSLCSRMWQFIQSDPRLRESTTLVLMPEFGRDPDGSTTNGFFNHRTNTESCRLVWMMLLGRGVPEPAVVERAVRQIDLAPTLGALLGVECREAQGRVLSEVRL